MNALLETTLKVKIDKATLEETVLDQDTKIQDFMKELKVL